MQTHFGTWGYAICDSAKGAGIEERVTLRDGNRSQGIWMWELKLVLRTWGWVNYGDFGFV